MTLTHMTIQYTHIFNFYICQKSYPCLCIKQAFGSVETLHLWLGPWTSSMCIRLFYPWWPLGLLRGQWWPPAPPTPLVGLSVLVSMSSLRWFWFVIVGLGQGCLNGCSTVKFTVRTSTHVCVYPADTFLSADRFLYVINVI
jgi:hypothetical protein